MVRCIFFLIREKLPRGACLGILNDACCCASSGRSDVCVPAWRVWAWDAGPARPSLHGRVTVITDALTVKRGAYYAGAPPEREPSLAATIGTLS